MIALEILESYRSQVDMLGIEKAALAALKYQSAPSDAELSIIITDDEQLRALNQKFREIDAPTDVLSFPADFIDPESETPYLGDILIAYPRAEHQAAAGGHALMAELQLLVVHGILHLLGHDHAEPLEKEAMWAAQSQVLQQLGLEDLQIIETD